MIITRYTSNIHNTGCTSHNIPSSYYSLQRLELGRMVLMTSDNVPHFSHYISKASQLKELVLRDVWDRDVRGRYVHNRCVEESCRELYFVYIIIHNINLM